jgi:glycolate oxidase
VAGYDLTKLIVGSEGTLGVVTKVIVKLLPLPETVRTLAAFFRNVEDAARAASKILASRLLPRALELVDQAALRAVESYLGEDFSNGAAAMLLVEVDGPSESTAYESGRIADIVMQSGAAVRRAESAAEQSI